MLSKKTVIGAFILLALIGGTFWHLHVQRIMNTEPTKVYKAPETPAATPTTGGHWHGDEWHAEPHPAPKPAKPPRPFIDMPGAQVVTPAKSPKQETQKGWSYLWRDIDVDLPPEDAPRPFKHLGFKELLKATRSQFTGEEALQLHYEVFFRMSKEQREDLRRSREEARRARDKAIIIEEFHRLYPPSETD